MLARSLVRIADAGAYGNAPKAIELAGPPNFKLTIKHERCFDETGAQIEGHPIEPAVRVELDPKDLANGIDTQLEVASAMAAKGW